MKKILLWMVLIVAACLPALAQSSVTQALNAATSNCAIPTQCAQVTVAATDTTASIQLSGTFVATILFEASANGQSWAAINGTPWGSGSVATSATATGGWSFDVSGKTALRARPSAYTSGTIVASMVSVAVRSGGSSGSSGTVNCTGCATDTNQTSGGQLTQIVDAGGAAANVTGTSLDVNVTGGSTGNGAASNTGSAVPTQADYQGLKVSSNLVGQTGTDEGSSIIAADVHVRGGTVTVTDGSGALNTIVDSGTLTTVSTVSTITNPVTITDGAGALNTIVDSGTLTAVTSITNAVTVTDGSGALNTIVDSGTLTAVTTITNPVTVTDGAGALNTIVDSGTLTAVTTITNPVTITSAQTGSGTATGAIRVELPTNGTGTVGLIAGSALIGQTANVATATTANAATRCVLVSAATTNATNCKVSAGNLYGFRFINTTATLYYLRMYNLASAPTCSSATGFIESIPIPASASGAGMVAMEPMGEAYSTGIGFCFTAGSTSTDNSAADVGVFGTILYK